MQMIESPYKNMNILDDFEKPTSVRKLTHIPVA